MRKRTYSLLLGLGIGLMIALISSILVYYFFGVKNVAQIKKKYEVLTEQYNDSNMRNAYMFAHDVQMDQKIDISDLISIKLPSKYEFTSLVQDPKEIEEILASVDISKGAILQKEMIHSELEIQNDLREFEFQGLQMPINMRRGDYVDIRVSFPSGLDFVVLSKKKVIEILKVGNEDHFTEYCILYLDTDEILRLKSAIVDAYINEGTYLYSTIYVKPDKQKAIEITYPVNENVRKIIQDDPNIVSRAMKALDIEKRKLLDESLQSAKENVDWNKELKSREKPQKNEEERVENYLEQQIEEDVKNEIEQEQR